MHFFQDNENAELLGLATFSIYLLDVNYDSGTGLGLALGSETMCFVNFLGVW